VSTSALRIGILGAGAIGGFVGLRLSAGGAAVTLVGRSELVAARDTLRAIPIGGPMIVPGSAVVITDDVARLAEVELCIVAVKSAQTGAAALTLAEHLPADAVVVSFQNGMHNADTLEAALGPRVAAGIVSYNVNREPGYQLRQATTGKLIAQRLSGSAGATLERLQEPFRVAGERFEIRDDIEDLMAGKLLLNLNNGVCAATGLSIADSLRSRDARRVFAACIREGLAVFAAHGRHPRSIVGIPPAVIARVLALPDWLVLTVAKSLISVDPRARSSTLQDLDRGRATEIDELNGEVVALAAGVGVATPANATIVDLIHAHEARAIAGDAPKFVTPAQLLARIRAAGSA
jgi:2-dehydropantoate 2-reductase